MFYHMTNKKVKNILSKISSFGIILLILVISLLIVLYARGYNLDLSNFSITSSGIIRINTTPNNSQVYLNNKYVGVSPLVLNSIDPGSYYIKILKNNYTEWNSLVTVKSGNITNVDSFLLPSQVDQSIVKTDGNIYKVIYNDNSNYIYIITDKSGVYKLYYINLSLITNGYSLNYVANLSKIINFSKGGNISIKSNTSLSDLILKYNNRYYIYNVLTNKLTLLSKLIYIYNLENINWTDSPNYIVIKDNNLLATLSLSTDQVYLLSYNSMNVVYRNINSSQIIFSSYSSTTGISDIFISNLDGTDKVLAYKIKGDVNNIFVNDQESYIAIGTTLRNNYLLSFNNNILSNEVPFANGNNIVSFNSQNNYILTEKNNTLYAYYVNNLSNITVIDNYNELSNIKLYSLGSYIFYQKKNIGSNTYSLYEQTIGGNSPVLISKDTVGNYYITIGGNYLFFNYYYNNNTYLYAVTLIKNNNIFPFSL